MLELILLLGNYMNSGSKNGGVYAFEMNFLTKVGHLWSFIGRHVCNFRLKKNLLSYQAFVSVY